MMSICGHCSIHKKNTIDMKKQIRIMLEILALLTLSITFLSAQEEKEPLQAIPVPPAMKKELTKEQQAEEKLAQDVRDIVSKLSKKKGNPPVAYSKSSSDGWTTLQAVIYAGKARISFCYKKNDKLCRESLRLIIKKEGLLMTIDDFDISGKAYAGELLDTETGLVSDQFVDMEEIDKLMKEIDPDAAESTTQGKYLRSTYNDVYGKTIKQFLEHLQATKPFATI